MVGLNGTPPLNFKVAELSFCHESLFFLIYYAWLQLYILNFVVLGIIVCLYNYIIYDIQEKRKKGVGNHKPKRSEGTFPLENLPVGTPPWKSLP